MEKEKISVLIIDDEASVRTAISAGLKSEGIASRSAGCAADADALLKTEDFDVILLDLILPDISGYAFLHTLRQSGNYTPVIVLSGLGEDSSMVRGYELGADDYVTKPFSKAVLASKIHALCRRKREYTSRNAPANTLSCGPVELHLNTQTASLHGEPLSLSAKEFAILSKLIECPGQVLSKEELYREVWQTDHFDNAKMLVYIKRIRDKIETEPASPKHLLTEWGRGYYFVP